jgi:agmatine deiminase
MINLIADWDTDGIILILPTASMNYYNEFLTELEFFYADFLKKIAQYDRVICLVPDRCHLEKMMRLTGLKETCFCEAVVEDIWIRDFAPIQSEQTYIKFIFNPAYESRFNNELFERSFMNYFLNSQLKDYCFDTMYIDLRLEGGNFTHNGKGTAIATEKLYSQNRHKTREEIHRLLKEKLFLEKLVIVPTEPNDRTGHIDGMIRWLDCDRIAIDNYQANDARKSKFLQKLNSCLEQNLPDVEKIKVPYSPSIEQYRNWFSAKGNYINFLRTKHQVYVPIYHLPDEDRVKEFFIKLFGDRVSFIDARVLSKYGGAFNCITWTYKALLKQHEINKRSPNLLQSIQNSKSLIQN